MSELSRGGPAARAASGALALLAVVLAGCSGLEPRAPLPPPPPAHVPAADEAPRLVALAPVRLLYEPSDPLAAPPPRWLSPLDPGVVRARTGSLLVERGSVPATRELPPLPEGPPNPLEKERLAALATAARPLGATHVLDLAIERAACGYEDQTGIFGLKVAFTVFFFPLDIPNYFIASDRFALETRARWKLVEVASGKVLAEGVVTAKETGRFGDFSRGWYFVGYIRVPQCLSVESWQKIEAVLLPGGQEALAEQVVLAVEGALK